MGDRNKKGRRAAEPRGQPGSATPKRRRQRLPVQAILSLDDSLAANEHHPLGQSAPEVRDAGRVRLIAAVLARMARSAMGRRD